MRDLRDPTILGECLLETADDSDDPLGEVYDRYHHSFEACPDYEDEGPLERYGDPRLLPSTMPN